MSRKAYPQQRFRSVCAFAQSITKMYVYNFDPLKPHFYTVKLGFTGVYIIFSYFCLKHRMWVLVRTASSRRLERVPTIYILSRYMKNIRIFICKFSVFGGEIFSINLNKRVFVMLVRIFTGLILDSQGCKISPCGLCRLIRMCGCASLFESRWTHRARRYVFSGCVSNILFHRKNIPEKKKTDR